MDPPEDLDRELWVEVEGYEGRSYLLGNAHSHLGRMSAWNDAMGLASSISTYQVLAASDGARRWMDGFLCGNEPSLKQFLGARVDDDFPEDTSTLHRYWAAMTRFRAEGKLGFLYLRPLHDPPSDAPVPVQLWARAGAGIVKWGGDRWTWPSDPPEVDGRFLVGSLCHERDEHASSPHGPRFWICSDCGWCEEVEPEPEGG
jgi:hypothetical protein